MILQLCRVVKNKTDDGWFEFPQVAIGMDVWIMPATISMMRYRRAGTQEVFKALCVNAKDQQKPIPVEILEFTNQFEVEGYKEN
jgi:hypothetical protein